MSADLVFRGGRVFTGHSERPFTHAVAITGQRISAVGDGVDDQAGAGTEVIDLNGGMLTPGFIDAHVHPATSGLDRLRVSFEGCSDAAGALAAVRDYAISHLDEPWVVGAGWSMGWFDRGTPDKESLDEAVPDRPAVIWSRDGHSAWVNSAALAIGGIHAGTPDPGDGRIERLPDGRPQGTLHEGAVRLVEEHAPPDTVADFERGLLRGQSEMFRHGITGWQDAHVGRRVHEAYLRLAGRGDLIGRVVGAMWWSRSQGLEQLDGLVERREQSGRGFRPISVKIMLDGVAENFTGAMLEPWLDENGRPTGNSGTDFFQRSELFEIVTALDREGFQCHFHAIGDRAVRNALDAVEEARKRNGPSDNRHHIAHLQVVHPADIPRFSLLGVVANAQPVWAQNDDYQTDLTQPFLGPVRSTWQYPFGDLARSGARLAMGSDWGVSTANVLEEAHVAILRKWDPDEEPLGPEQGLRPVEVLAGFTSGSAYVNHAERDTGSISVGKLADLAVLDRDPIEEGPFREARVVMTLVGGEVVYEEN